MNTDTSATPAPSTALGHEAVPASEGFNPVAWLLGLVFNDMRTKAMALVFAVLVWVYINNEITTQTTLVIPVRVEVNTPEIIVTNVTPPQLKLVISGPKERISLLEGKTLARTVRIQAEDLPKGEETRSLERSPERFFRLPPGIRLSREAERVKITVVRALTRSLKVIPQLVGEPAPGFEVKKITLDISEVRVRGPITVMKKLVQIKTREINIAGRATGTIRKFVDVQDRIDGEPLTYMEERPVLVRIEIGPETKKATRKFTTEIRLEMPADFPYVNPKSKLQQVTLVLTGPANELEAAARQIRVIVRLDQYDAKALETHWKGTNYKLTITGVPENVEAQVTDGKDPVPHVYIQLTQKK